MKFLFFKFFFVLLVFLLSIGYSQNSNLSKSFKKQKTIIVGSGVATVKVDKRVFTPTLNLNYMFKTYPNLGHHLEFIVGLSEQYGGISWQMDFWLIKYLRAGAGFGVTPFFNLLPGNPIIIPLPEASVGIHIPSGNWNFSLLATNNLAYGARGNLGLGFTF